jgi:hypothetical protein
VYQNFVFKLEADIVELLVEALVGERELLHLELDGGVAAKELGVLLGELCLELTELVELLEEVVDSLHRLHLPTLQITYCCLSICLLIVNLNDKTTAT